MIEIIPFSVHFSALVLPIAVGLHERDAFYSWLTKRSSSVGRSVRRRRIGGGDNDGLVPVLLTYHVRRRTIAELAISIWEITIHVCTARQS